MRVRVVLHTAHAALPALLKAAEQKSRRVADLVDVSSVVGRVARVARGIYNLTKFGVGAFSESLRQEVTARHVRVSLVEPGATETEVLGHMSPERQAQSRQRLGNIERLQAEDIADANRLRT